VRSPALPPERFLGAVRAGLRYARGAPDLKAVLARTFSFFLFSSALLALLPLVGRRTLGLDASHYGLLLGSMGVGAVAAAVALKRVAARVSADRLSSISSLALCAAMLALAHAGGLVSAMCCMFVAGGSWITTLSILNGAAQRASPAWAKARILAIYLVCFQGAMAVGAVLWGTLASTIGVAPAITCAAAGLLLAIPLSFVFPLPEGGDLEPSLDWPSPHVAGEPMQDRGPVMVTIEYRVDPDRVATFSAAMHALERSRRRDGAYEWGVFEDAAEPGRFVEMFLVSSWLEHLRQHERHTHADVPLQDAVRRFHLGGSPPLVRHLIAPSRT
jgi:MFS family permease